MEVRFDNEGFYTSSYKYLDRYLKDLKKTCNITPSTSPVNPSTPVVYMDKLVSAEVQLERAKHTTRYHMSIGTDYAMQISKLKKEQESTQLVVSELYVSTTKDIMNNNVLNVRLKTNDDTSITRISVDDVIVKETPSTEVNGIYPVTVMHKPGLKIIKIETKKAKDNWIDSVKNEITTD